MANPDRIDAEAPDDKLAAVCRAIAYELLQLGYRPAPHPGQALLEGHPPRTVDPEIWEAMKDLLAGGQP
jgi:hypothetical protein